MTPTQLALMGTTLVPALVVLWYCICTLNQMTPTSPHGPRVAVILIAAGVFAELVSIMAGRTPDVIDILILTGLMVLVRSNCRRGVCPCVALPTWPERRKRAR
jgi:RsiW-degrading membrane proteinase PrsW (M82 family)